MDKVMRGRWVIAITFLIALMLEVLPLPVWVVWLRPAWTLLVLIYWAMALPYIAGVLTAFCVGILLDLLTGTLLGEHAFVFIIITYIVIKQHRLIRVYPLFQQTLIVLMLVLLYKILIFAIQGIIGLAPYTYMYWLSAIVSALLWPWVFILLRDWRRRFHLS